MGRKKPDNPEYVNKWQIPMFTACFDRPCTCCFFCFCPCIPAYQHRKVLIGDPENYVCCNGELGCCSTCFNPCTKPCPEFCMFCEACCCTGTAVLVNRNFIRDRFKLEFTPCEDCIFTILCVCDCVICICKVLGQDCEALEFLIDCLYYSTMGCMNTQHEVELEKGGLLPASENMQ
eukprot:TRINITY_DN1453_c0_g1_i1.p1 TRINITY_DN1453_c0_g1~~TRINITY_DN1453_c0_g1_i1.p1  ORF type:complete len:176 (+),score=10.89 TRINITY_DN1453_c0_g1_i1:57-584(+)